MTMLIKGRYKVSEVVCLKCLERFVQTRLAEVPLCDIKCPKCGRKGFVIETGEIVVEMDWRDEYDDSEEYESS